jgi:hypothetical protein
MVEVKTAYYGALGSSKDRVDVTAKLKSLLSADRKTLTLLVSAENIGVKDPSPGNPKELIIQYTIDNVETTETIRDGSTLMLKASEPYKQSWGGVAISSVTNVWTNVLIVIAIFLYVMSIMFAYEFGKTLFNPVIWVVAAIVLPYLSFWGIPIILILMRIFSSQDFIVLSGGRRK